MATKKKRITVSLDDATAHFVERCAHVLGKPQSAIVVDIMKESVSTLAPIIDDLEKAQRGDITRTKFMANVLRATSRNVSDKQIDMVESITGEKA